MTAHDEQPAPAGDDELREAEEWGRHVARDPRQWDAVVEAYVPPLMAEYDERGRELERLRDELDEWEAMRNEWRDKAYAKERELERLRVELERTQAEAIRLRAIEQRAWAGLDPLCTCDTCGIIRRILGEAP